MEKPVNPPQADVCPACGAGFTCGNKAGAAECWCSDFPPLMSVPEPLAAACYCPACLRKRIEAVKAS